MFVSAAEAARQGGGADLMPLSLRDSIARSRPRIREDAVIEARAGLLLPEDRDLLLAVWTYHQPTRMLAELVGLTPQAVRRRVRLLIKRVHSERFVGAARAMHFLDAQQAEMARLHFCNGLSLRQTARAMRIGYHSARRLACAVAGIVRGLKNVRLDGSPGSLTREGQTDHV